MAQNNPFRKPKQHRADDPDLLQHIDSLGLRSVSEYVAWCREHGFSSRTAKHWKERLKERSFTTRVAADARLARKKDEIRRPENVIESIFRGEMGEDDVTEPSLKTVCEAFTASRNCHRTRQALLSLLTHVARHTPELLDRGQVIAAYGWQAGNSYVEALAALARSWQSWLRPVDEWKARTHSVRRQFSSLSRHLLARYRVPGFMDAVWFKGDDFASRQQQHWFVHLGRGESIRTANLPLTYTKRMAHHFMQAPAELSVEAALRWGQIHALGGNASLVRTITATRLGSSFEHDEFWTSVLRFFIAHPMIDRAQVGPIIDFIHHQKFVSEDVIVAPDRIERRPPPQPNFTMKGRTPESLLRQVEQWHGTLAKKEQPRADWASSGIPDFEFVEGSEKGENLKIWTLTELLSSKSLYSEGRAMKHCVATYGGMCAHRETSIWTLEVESFEERRKVLTVEVDLRSRTICQARGKCNVRPTDKHRSILRRWAEQSQLNLASYV